MILTRKFVYVHLPKTGGTFVTSVLERLLKPPKPRTPWGRLLRRVRGRVYRDTNKHGTCSEIPPSHRGLPVVSTIRNPFDRYVSQYEFAWWKEQTREWIDRRGLRERFPRFPDLTFPEFVDAASSCFHQMKDSPLRGEDALGFHSEQFVRYFFRDPKGAWPRIDEAYIRERRFEADMHPVRFLRQESLNGDLHRFLLEVGFPEEEVAFVPDEGRILPEGGKPRKVRDWRGYYTPELRALVRRRERLLFALFPEYDAP